MPLVSPSTSMAAPTTTPVPPGAPPPGTAPTAGQSVVPMGMPMGMLGSPGGTDAGKRVPADKKIVVPAPPHRESVTGKAVARLAAAQAES
jgi:hypothetical protein